ncbi:MAG: hypothetical protein H6620_09125 [Halobacteriovoraceae bacterium]|nr:hypothetical protein [Halobacteriovoraceae bacterium]
MVLFPDAAGTKVFGGGRGNPHAAVRHELANDRSQVRWMLVKKTDDVYHLCVGFSQDGHQSIGDSLIYPAENPNHIITLNGQPFNSINITKEVWQEFGNGITGFTFNVNSVNILRP